MVTRLFFQNLLKLDEVVDEGHLAAEKSKTIFITSNVNKFS